MGCSMSNKKRKKRSNGALVLKGKINNSTNEFYLKKVLSNELILSQLAQFLEEEDIQCLSLCSKEIHKLYRKQIKKLKIKKGIDISFLLNVNFDEYEKLVELDLTEVCIEDYSFISKFEKLKILYLCATAISDISFLE